MKDLIANLPNQIREAINIAEQTNFNTTEKRLSAILVCGLGGSGIGGKIVSLLLKYELNIPFLCVNDYDVPAWVNENTLVIASSYSGNTEETLAAVAESVKRGAEIAVITSSGELLDRAKANGWNHFVVPGGEQPRAMLAYSVIQQLFILQRYGLISPNTTDQLKQVPVLIEKHENNIQEEAMRIAEAFVGHRPIIYAETNMEGVAVRWRQQINENAKELCWHHIYPEMTHNELVGWAGGSEQLVPLFLATDYDHPRSTRRWEISKEIIPKYAGTLLETKAKGDSRVAQNFYLIHLGDWVSYFMSEIKKVDAVEVDVIHYLKSEMSKMN